MHQIHPDEGLTELLKRIAEGFLKYRLFTNNITPGPASVFADFNEVTGGTGYAAQTYDEADFTAEGVAGHIGSITATDVVFSVASSSYSVYGYYVTDSANTKVLAAGRFSDAPRTLDSTNPISIPAKLAINARYTS